MRDRVRAVGQLVPGHGERALPLVHAGVPADVPGDDLLAGHVVHGREVRLGAGDLELGDVGAEPDERPVRPEVAFERVRHLPARVAPVRAVSPPGAGRADRAFEPHAAHDPEHGLGRHPPPEPVDQAHADLPVAAPVRRPRPDLAGQRFEAGPRHMPRARQAMEVCGSGQPGYPQQMAGPVSPPCEQSDDGASLASRDLFARRARSFSRHATFAPR